MITKEQKLINALADKLPIKVYSERMLLPKLREACEGFDIKPTTLFEIRSMVDLRDEGGIGCEIYPIGFEPEKPKTAMLVSITHLIMKRGEPLYDELEKYKIKRIKKLALQNRFG